MEQNGEPRDPNNYSQLTFEKGAKAIQWRKDSLFNKWCWNNWTSTCKTNKQTKNLNPDLIPFTKIISKWIIYLNVKCKTMKLLEDSKGENLDDLGFGSDL